MAKTIFKMADGIFTPCNVARTWHWFRQVTAPCNVACGSGIVTVNSPSGSTLQCDTWLWDDIHWIRPVAAPCSVAGGSGMTMPLHSPKRPTYWNSTSGFDFDHITAVDMSFCTSLRNFIQIGPPSAEKMTSCRFSRWRISAILDFKDPIMGSLQISITTY